VIHTGRHGTRAIAANEGQFAVRVQIGMTDTPNATPASINLECGQNRFEVGSTNCSYAANCSTSKRTSSSMPPTPVTRVAPARVGAWRQGGLAALDEPLRDVLAELTRRYGTEIVLEGDVAGDALVSLFYPQAPALDVVLADLCTAQGLRFRQTSRGVVIARALPPE
jgi:ferric-dicitrate binding protein FerR (iron transport regulator)